MQIWTGDTIPFTFSFAQDDLASISSVLRVGTGVHSHKYVVFVFSMHLETSRHLSFCQVLRVEYNIYSIIFLWEYGRLLAHSPPFGNTYPTPDVLGKFHSAEGLPISLIAFKLMSYA